MNDEHVEELIDLYALGALEPAEQAAVDEHLDSCPRCRLQAEEAKRIVLLLAWTPDQHDPPPHLRERVQRRIAQLQRLEGNGPRLWWQRLLAELRRPATALAYAAALVLALLSVGLAGRLGQTRGELATLQERLAQQQQVIELLRAPDTRLVTFQSQTTPGTLRLLLDPDGRSAYVIAAGLPPLPADRTYQLWLIDGNAPVSAGLLTVDAQGTAIMRITSAQPLSRYRLAGVTIEPAGGSPQPTMQPILVATL